MRRGALVLLSLVVLLWAGAAPGRADVSTSFPTSVFADGFESGSLSAWNGTPGNGLTTAMAGSAHTGSYGVNLTNAAGQYSLLTKSLGTPQPDTSTRFWVRVNSAAGFEEIAQARDAGSSARMWELLYDAGSRGIYFYPYRSSGSTELYTGAGSLPLNTWTQIEVRYTATATGGARIYINGATQPGWGMTGDFTRSSDYATLQLWNDAANSTDFDDVSVSAAAAAATAPTAPTGATATAGNASAALSWTAPASNGGSPITSYRITPYANGVAQTPIDTGSTGTTRTMAGLTNGTNYTFTVAATNAVGTGAASDPSPAVTPRSATAVPGSPSNVAGSAGDRSVALTWTAPTDDGGSAVTGYRITPYVGTTAQTATVTTTNATSATVTGLANGTGYTFRVAAVNAVGTGTQSTASATITPVAAGPSTVEFSDGFETGTLANWTGAQGTGTASATALASHTGGYGLRLNNAIGQYALAFKALPRPINDSLTRFWIRTTATSGIQEIAQGRDGASSGRMFELYYDANRQGVYFYPYQSSGATEIFTGANTLPRNTWAEIQIRYTATTNGAAQIYINGQTQAAWRLAGNFTRSADYQVLQLWNDGTGIVDFDDVSVLSAPSVAAAPTNVTGSTGNATVALNWTAPANDGGSAITGYRITPSINGVAQDPILTNSIATSYLVTGLDNGTAYTFTVASVNDVGIGGESAATSALTPSATATPPTAPGAPTGRTGDRSVALDWTAPVSDGGRTITGYLITPVIGGIDQTPIHTPTSATKYTVMGLNNNAAYTFRVAAINAAGTGADSPASASFTPSYGGPTDVVFADGFESGNLSAWNSTMGTGQAYAAGAAQHAGGYGARMINASGQYSLLSKTLPTAITDSTVRFWFRTTASSGVQEVAQARDGNSSGRMWELAYDAPRGGLYFYPYRGTTSTEIFTGAASVPNDTWVEVQIRYQATTSGGAQLYVNGLTQSGWGVSGDYSRTLNLQTVQLWNDGAGTVDFDDVSVAGPPNPGATAPGAPTSVAGVARDGAADVSWTAPSSTGGSPITSYRITPQINGVDQTPINTGSSTTARTVTGLTNGTAYTFTVAATNAVGTGSVSSPSASVTPKSPTAPDRPAGVTGTRRDGAVALSWQAPGDDGGSAITSYRITPSVNGVAQAPIDTGSTATSRTVSGLTNGTAYTFTVAAVNAFGTSLESDPSAAVTPRATSAPDPPTSLTGTARDSRVTLNWRAPADDGGSAITSYRITPYVGTTAQSAIDTGSDTTTYAVTGLTNNTTYTFKVAATNAIGTGAQSDPSAALTPVPNPPNPIVVENQKPGTTSWQFDDFNKAMNHEIEGYASATSVNKGDSIGLKVSTSSTAQYTMDVYRMGWYPTGTNPDGTSCAPSCGGRLMQHIGPLTGTKQPTCPQNNTSTSPDYGLTECNWSTSYTLSIPSTWTTGNYVVKLRRSDGTNLENYMTFVVRDDANPAAVVYSMDSTTWQAYNYWGGAGNNNVGISLYGRTNDVTNDEIAGSRAYTVSFDRPYLVNGATDGAGMFFVWDFPLVRWMESQGYDMTYVTSTDLENNPSVLAGHKVLVHTGHDEYYSDNMRQRVTDGISAGINMAFFSANDFYHRITWAADSAGTALRRVHTDKGAQTGLATVEFRSLAPPRPENQISGLLQNGVANNRTFLVDNASSWIYQGTGLKSYTGNGTSGIVTSGPNQNAIPGLIGYEFDTRPVNASNLSQYVSYDPAGIIQVGHSFVPAADNGVNTWSDATLRTAPSGAQIFAAGTMQWAFGLDNGEITGFCDCDHSYANAASRRITKNILDRFTG